jgi:drug/metabolite transporter (DMT)-like permease
MNRRAVLRCLAAAVLFGASAPAAAELTGDLPTLVLAGLLYVGAAVAMVPSSLHRPPTWSDVRHDGRATAVAVVVGGAIGPALLVAGLARTDSATASILLNLELVATVVLAATVFHEHLGRRVVAGTALVTLAGVVLVWSPGAGVTSGGMLVALACVCWGIDNGVTAGIGRLAPQHVVVAKGAVAGTANLVLGLWLADGAADAIALGDVAAALVIGALGYGVSITLWVQGARELGAARAQLIFSTAPFVGALVAWVVFDAPFRSEQVVAIALAGVGVWWSLDSAHSHPHEHAGTFHDHPHVPDASHRHSHRRS